MMETLRGTAVNLPARHLLPLESLRMKASAGDFEFAWKRALDPDQVLTTADTLYDIKGAEAYHQGKVKDPQPWASVFLRRIF